MACQPGCSCTQMASLRKRKSNVLDTDNEEDIGIPKLKKTRSSPRFASTSNSVASQVLESDIDEDIGIPKLKKTRSSLRLASTSHSGASLSRSPTLQLQGSTSTKAMSSKNLKRKFDSANSDFFSPPTKRLKKSESLKDEEQSPQTNLSEFPENGESPSKTPMEIEVPIIGSSDFGQNNDSNKQIPGSSTEDQQMEVTIADTNEEGASGVSQEDNQTNDETFESDWKLICEVHPDCDPVYIREQLFLLVNDPLRVSTVTFDIFSNEQYPKREDREDRERWQREKQILINMPFEMESYLKKYPDPMTVFNDKESDVYELYYDHAETFLKNEFPWMQVNLIVTTLRKAGFHLTPAYIELKKINDAFMANQMAGNVNGRSSKKKKAATKRFRLYPRSDAYEYPENADDDFYWERLFLINKDQILGHLHDKAEARRIRLEQAKAEGKLHECPICLEPEVLEEDMLPCNGKHLFCIECIRKNAEEKVSQGSAKFPCLDPSCSEQFSLYNLEKALSSHTYSLAARTVQIAEVREAEIEHLEHCPFCPYAIIVPYDNTATIFHCENEECLRDSCRKCKDVAHSPYGCAEFKNNKENTMRTFVENKMAEAMIRVCPKCNLRFFKEEGCNHMTCSCGTHMCYVCKELIQGYNHFRKNPRCNQYQYQGGRDLHRMEVEEAYKNAEDVFREEHPEFSRSDFVLNYNPMDMYAPTPVPAT